MKGKGVTLDRQDYLILNALRELNALNTLFASTIIEIQEADVVANRTTIWKHLQILISLEYVAEGSKFRRQKSYFITEAGLQILGGYDLYDE